MSRNEKRLQIALNEEMAQMYMQEWREIEKTTGGFIRKNPDFIYLLITRSRELREIKGAEEERRIYEKDKELKLKEFEEEMAKKDLEKKKRHK